MQKEWIGKEQEVSSARQLSSAESYIMRNPILDRHINNASKSRYPKTTTGIENILPSFSSASVCIRSFPVSNQCIKASNETTVWVSLLQSLWNLCKSTPKKKTTIAKHILTDSTNHAKHKFIMTSYSPVILPRAFT